MAHSSERKQALVGWFVNNTGSSSDIQLQNFLFFYELLSKIDGDNYELDGLIGCKDDTTESTVLSDAELKTINSALQ